MISDREMRVRLMVDQEEREYRKRLRFVPTLKDLCSYCFQEKDRRGLRMVKPGLSYSGEYPSCRDCIERYSLTISDSEESVRYDARTQAILNIRGI